MSCAFRLHQLRDSIFFDPEERRGFEDELADLTSRLPHGDHRIFDLLFHEDYLEDRIIKEAIDMYEGKLKEIGRV